MKGLWIVVFLLVHYKVNCSTIYCKETDNCRCFPEAEIQCPASSEDKLVIHIDRDTKTLKIECHNLKDIEMSLLPNITLQDITRLEIRDCSLPNFKRIADHFSLPGIKVLQFELASNVSLTKKHLEGFNLEILYLNVLTFTYLEDEVFSTNPHLLYLDIQRNKNLTLTSESFKDLTSLKGLYLATNGLEDIPNGLFQNLKSLKSLHLWENKLKILTDDTFIGLSNLTTLELRDNKIENISENAFQTLTQLTKVNLSGNKLETVFTQIFRSNTKIKTIWMHYNPNLQLPDYLFADLPALESVNLSSCNISFLPEHVFENSTNLTDISLENNKLTSISPNLFQGLVNLKILNLRKNLISRIDGDVFKDLRNLEEVHLEHNRIKVIHCNAFNDKNKARIIDLSYNQFEGDTGTSCRLNILEDATNVQTLDFSHNSISRIADVVSVRSMLNLRKLNFDNNNITELKLSDLHPYKDLEVNLDNNNITRVNFENIDLVEGSELVSISLAGNPLECDCTTFELVQFTNGQIHEEKRKMFDISIDDLVCAKPIGLKDVPLKQLPPLRLKCELQESSYCPSKCSCNWTPFDKSMVVNCTNRNLTEFPIIHPELKNQYAVNQTVVFLQGNFLTNGPNSLGYDNVTKLYLSHNKIRNLEWLPPKLEVLHLDNNELRYLSQDVLHFLNNSRLVNLTLSHNKWTCDCSAANFTNFLREHPRTVHAGNIYCSNTTKLLVNLSETDLCHTNLIFFIIIPALSIVLLIAVLIALFFRFQQEIKVWLFAHDLCLWWVTAEELDKEKLYDAFISYSNLDEDFVVTTLVPRLEGGPNPYKLCIHVRDFVPGEFISAQVTKSVLDSRRTVVILSQNFLDSVWGKMEFRTAHSQAMTEGRTRVIIVLYGDVDMEKMDDELKAYVKTNTYVKWGDPYFWQKLKYALPHSKLKVAKSKQKMANMMNYIDDKFSTAVPIKTSSETTPPLVKSVDCIKKERNIFSPGLKVSNSE